MTAPLKPPFAIYVERVSYAASTTEQYCMEPSDPPDPRDKFLCQIRSPEGKTWQWITREAFTALFNSITGESE